LYDDIERKAAGIQFQMYVKRCQQQHHHSICLGTSSSVAGRTSPPPTPTLTIGTSNPVVLQAPVVQHIRAANGRCGGNGSCMGGQSAGFGGSVTRNEPHPLARLATAADRDVDVNDDVTTTRSSEASLDYLYVI